MSAGNAGPAVRKPASLPDQGLQVSARSVDQRDQRSEKETGVEVGPCGGSDRHKREMAPQKRARHPLTQTHRHEQEQPAKNVWPCKPVQCCGRQHGYEEQSREKKCSSGYRVQTEPYEHRSAYASSEHRCDARKSRNPVHRAHENIRAPLPGYPRLARL